jgi:hypothetical protein
VRSDNSAFSTVNKARNRELFFVVEMAFDLANTDLLYLTFDTTPGLSGANVINGCLESISGSTQKINPDKALSTIGAMTFSVIDIGLTDYQKAKLTSGNGLRGKRARFYVGGAGLDWTAFVLAQTQIIDSVDFKDGVYTFKCADIQRQMRVDIFDMKKTALSGHLGKSDLTIPVYSTDGFYRVKHPVSLDGRPDAHGQKVGYIKITQGDDVEIIRYTGTNTGEFTGCTRGVLGTRAIEIALPVDDEDVITTNANNAPKVEEYVYLELPAPMLAYALLTGSIYGEPGEYLPPHWHLGISTDFVKTSDFTGIGTDWWDPTNADLGVVAVIKGQTKTDGKKFIEEQIYRMLGAFSPVYSTGELGLKRLTVVISAGGHDRALDSSNIIDYGELTHDMKSVINKIAITWNWVETRKAYTRTNILLDTDSIARHGESDPLELTLRCLETSRHSYTTLKSRFDSLRDRYAGPPLRLNLKLTPDQNDVEVGDIVRVNLAAIRDYSGDTIDGSLVRNFEIQQVSTDWVTGDVSVSLFGSSERAGAFAGDEVGTPIDSSFYYSEGTEINATNFPGKVSSAGGITTVLTNFTLAGSTDLNSAASIFYVNENLSVPDGKVIFGTGNVQLRVAGEALINGGIDLRGGGNAGGTPGADVANGWIGRSYSQPGLRYNTTPGNLNTGGSGFARGLHTATPEIALEIVNDAIVGLPSDITGQPGQSGGESYKYISNTSTKVSSATGGNGGAGGGGIAIIATGIDFGANGYIDTSGADGTAGSSFVDGSRTIYGGRGAGGAPGSIYFILTDENGARPQIDNSRQRCYYGSADASGYSALIDPDLFKTRHPKISDAPTGAISGFESETEWYATVLPSRPSPDHTTNLYYAWTKLAFLAGYVPAVEDVPKNSADVVSFTLTEYTNTPPSQKADLSTIEVSVTGPSDPNYSYAFIQYKIGLNDPWLDAGPASPEAVFVVPSDGTTYYARALAVSKSGARSPTGPIDNITVANVINDPDTAAPTVLTFDAITVYSESGGATFTGKDAKFNWNDDNSLKSYFLNYQIEILDGSSNLMRTETTTDPFYVYTYEKNKEDYKAFHSTDGANRAFSIRVTVLGRVEVTGGQYAGPSYTLPVSNPAPAAVGSLVISPGYGVVYVGGTNPTDLDFTQFAIHVSATPGFTASPSTLVGYATRLPITIAADAAGNKLSDGGQYYIRIESWDEFGAGGITTDYSALMLGIPAGTEIPVGEVLTVDGRIIADASADPYSVTLGPHNIDGRAALFAFENTTTGTPLVAFYEDGDAVFAGKIVVSGGSTGISSFSDAGALATQNSVAWDTDVSGKPNSLLQLDPGAASELASKASTFRQSTQPSSGISGDIWYDTINEILYRRSGSSWYEIANMTDWGNLSGYGKPDSFADVTSANTSYDTDRVNGTAAATVDAGASRANAGLNSSGEATKLIKSVNLPTSGMSTGLNMSGQYMGYYNAGWKTYIKNDGTFYFAGNGGNYIQWNGSVLSVRGDVVATSVTSGAINGQTITGVTVTGSTLKTATGTGKRIEARSSDNTLSLYDSINVARVILDTNATSENYGYISVLTKVNEYGIISRGAGKAGVFGEGSNYGVKGVGTHTDSSGVYGVSIPSRGGRFVTSYGPEALWAEVGGISSSTSTALRATAKAGFGVLAASTGNHGIISYGAGGKYDFYADGAGTDFGPFTGAHDALMLKTETLSVTGDIVAVTGIAAKRNVSNITMFVEPSAIAESAAAYGVIASRGDLGDYVPNGEFGCIGVSGLKNLTEAEYNALQITHDLLAVNGVGEGQINVCSANGDFEVGDFICTSTVAGKGQRYDGNDMRVVVAKALEPVDWSAETETTKMIACIYMCS